MYHPRSLPSSAASANAIAHNDIDHNASPILVLHGNKDARIQQLATEPIDSDSELTDLSDGGIAELEPFRLSKDSVHVAIRPKKPTNTSSSAPQASATASPMLGMQSDTIKELNDNSESDESDSRPRKRMKLNNSYDKADSSTVAYHKRAPASTDNHLSSSPSSSVLFNRAATSASSFHNSSRIALPPLLPPTLSPAIHTFTSSFSEANASRPIKSSLKMVILPKTEADALKSHNGILRSHNISLASQNAKLRLENMEALSLMQEFRDQGAIDHSDCVSKDDYNQIADENEKITKDLAKARYDSQLYKECGYEWARRENLWDVEKELMKNEVSDLVARVNQFEARETDLVDQIKQLHASVHGASQRAVIERTRVERLRQFVFQLQAQVAAARPITISAHSNNVSANDTGDAATSVYPEL